MKLLAHHPLPSSLALWEKAFQGRKMPTSLDDRVALVEDFLIYGQQRGYAAHTLKSYREAIADFFDFFKDADLRTIKPREIGQWLHWMMTQGKKRNTLTARLYAIRAFFDRAVLLDLMPSNPARLVPIHRYYRPLPKFLSEEEILRLINAAESLRDRVIFEVLYATGCRVGELAGMRIECISWSERTVRIMGKGQKERLVPLGRKAVEVLKAYLKRRRAGPVFLASEEMRCTQHGGLCLQDRQVAAQDKQANLFSTKSAAEKLGITYSTLLRWISSGKIKGPSRAVRGGRWPGVRLWTEADVAKIVGIKPRSLRNAAERRRKSSGKHWCVQWREEHKGKRRLRGKIIGTIEQFPTRELARQEAARYLATKPGVLGRHTFTRKIVSTRGITSREITRVVVDTARKAGLRHVHPHMLRHTFATHLLEHGADLITIKELLGHSSVATTQIYLSITKTHMEETLKRFHPRWQEEKNETPN